MVAASQVVQECAPFKKGKQFDSYDSRKCVRQCESMIEKDSKSPELKAARNKKGLLDSCGVSWK